jgi:hypothetical protein
VQFPVNVGQELAHKDDHIAQMLTPVALQARQTVDAGEYTVLGEQAGEPRTSGTAPSAKRYARRTSASVSGVIVISIWVSTRTCPGSLPGRLEVATGFR